VKGRRIGSNNEFQKLIKEDTVKNVKAQRIKWWGHLNRMDDTKYLRRLQIGTP
jgi:hypothetical protein